MSAELTQDVQAVLDHTGIRKPDTEFACQLQGQQFSTLGHLLGSSFSSSGAIRGDKNCRTIASERGMSCTEVYSKLIDVKLHKPRTTSIALLQITFQSYCSLPDTRTCSMWLYKHQEPEL